MSNIQAVHLTAWGEVAITLEPYVGNRAGCACCPAHLASHLLRRVDGSWSLVCSGCIHKEIERLKKPINWPADKVQ